MREEPLLAKDSFSGSIFRFENPLLLLSVFPALYRVGNPSLG